MNELHKVRSVTWHGQDVFELELERNELVFMPGDCLALYAEEGRVSRPYSISSGTDEKVLRFLVRRMKGGVVSTFLADRKPGDEVRVSPPFGWFRPGEKAGKSPFVFVATGTGIAPFLAYLRSRPAVAPVATLYGVRQLADAVDIEWLQKNGNLKLAISRENVSPHHHGRVTDLLAQIPCDGNADYYLCGLDAMIDDVTNWLEARGVDITRIHRECFFNASYSA